MKRAYLRAAIVLAISLVLVVFATPSWSRPGGGSSFRSSSSSSSSGSSYRSGSSSSGSSYRSSSSSSSSGSSYRSSSSSSSSSGSSYRSSSSSSSSSSGSIWMGSSTSSTSSGSSYSGSSGSSSDYGSSSTSSPSSDKSLGRSLFVIFLIIIVVVAVIILYSRWKASQENADWETRMNEPIGLEDEAIRATRHSSVQAALRAIRSEDDAFSAVLFEDFLYSLYAEAHTKRGGNHLDQLAPYLSDVARNVLGRYPAAEVFAIVVGGMRLESIETEGRQIRVQVIFTSNLSERDAAGRESAWYMEERWTFVRSASVKSRPPEKARIIGCPKCGAPLDGTVAAKCKYCGAIATPGQTDWFVETIDVGSREARGPMLTGTTEEEGTDWPTIVAPDAKRELQALQMRDATFQWPAFVKRVEHVFHAFHRSWVAQDLKGVRPYLSDNLYALQQYWVAAYEQQRLKNVTENPTVVTVHLAKVGRDKFYESITVRVFASCVDYTVDANGGLVGGRRDQVRQYSEYWTFIRGVGNGPRAPGQPFDACPSCGAPLADISMAGNCGHCNAKVTSGAFDWVLSRIEQDEVYERVA